ncbi:MAG: MBL fold metallo-hydrolase [Oscillospiraceae bacterium]|nr:MBL fold metallo-hydrolase [Oscillospiraceae bacterium]
MNQISSNISYLPAAEEPLSADVFLIEGEQNYWIYDVGNNEEALKLISGIGKEKKVILSHYHGDHTGNLAKLEIEDEKLYVGDLTQRKLERGTVIGDKLTVRDGVLLEIMRCASPHAGGCLIVTVDKTYTLLGDLYFSKPNKNRKMAERMLKALAEIETRYFVVSHQQGDNIFEKDFLLRELKEYFAKSETNQGGNIS